MAPSYTLTSASLAADAQTVIRSDGAAIPPDPANVDFQAYLAWLATGNAPAAAPAAPTVVPSALLWQLEAACEGEVTSAALAFTVPTWAQVQTAVAAQNSPALTAFYNVGMNSIPADSTTLLALAAALPTPLTGTQVSALVAAAGKIAIA